MTFHIQTTQLLRAKTAFPLCVSAPNPTIVLKYHMCPCRFHFQAPEPSKEAREEQEKDQENHNHWHSTAGPEGAEYENHFPSHFHIEMEYNNLNYK